MRRAKGLELAPPANDVDVPPHPRTRAECRDMPRPCLHLACRHHLAVDVSESGTTISIVAGPDINSTSTATELERAADAVLAHVLAFGSCSLDFADRGEATLEEIGNRLHVTRERIRQIEKRAVRRGARRLHHSLGRAFAPIDIADVNPDAAGDQYPDT